MPQNYLRNGIEVQKIDLCERALNKIVQDPMRYSFLTVLDTAESPKYPSPYAGSPTPEAPPQAPPEPLATPNASSNSMGGGADQLVSWQPPSNVGAYGSFGSGEGSAGLFHHGGLNFFNSDSPFAVPMGDKPIAPGSARAVAAAPTGTPLPAESDLAARPAENRSNVPQPAAGQGTPAQGNPAQGDPAQGDPAQGAPAEKHKPEAPQPVESGGGRGRGRGGGRGGGRGRARGATISQYELEREENIARNKKALESLGLGDNDKLAPKKKLKAKQQRQPPIYKVPQVRTHAVTHSATHTVTHAAPHGVTLSLLLTAYTL